LRAVGGRVATDIGSQECREEAPRRPVFTFISYMFIPCYTEVEGHPVGTARNRVAHKHFRLDTAKIKRAQRLLRTGTETETIDRALDEVIAEYERNRLTRDANERFVRSGIEIKDVYGKVAR